MIRIGNLTSFKLLRSERPDYFKIEIRIRLENGHSESFNVGTMTKELITNLILQDKIKVHADRKLSLR